jgi:hypothetical protein
MNRLNLCLIACIAIMMGLGCDSWVNVKGTVVDENQKSVPDARIVVWQGDHKVIESNSAKDGTFSIFQNIVPGPIASQRVVLEVTKDGFEPVKITFDAIEEANKMESGNFQVVLKHRS